MYSKRKKQNCGQLAIFIALIFQLVFILFAMSLNVALVVHDKINLQNSVDLAAYYGAMKQAQTLNAIAHVNYQIRQSWKLLAWRYRVLGNPYAAMKTPPGDQENSPPFNPETGSKDVYIVCTAAFNTKAGRTKGWGKFRLPISLTEDAKYLPPTSGQYEGEFCKKMDLSIEQMNTNIATSSILPGITTAIRTAALKGNMDITKKCQIIAYTNWLFALFSLYHFRMDQSRKAKLIYKIADQIAENGMEMDRENNQVHPRSIADGARKTFANNLTYINRQAYDSNPNSFQFFNSLEGEDPDRWLSAESFYVYPLMYVHTSGMTVGQCEGEARFINNVPDDPTYIRDNPSFYFKQLAEKLILSSSYNSLCKELGGNNLCEFSAGLSKKDNFIVYFGAKADLEYENQIFLPFFTNHKLKLKAQAFAKPFGGRIGPKRVDDPTLPNGPPPPVTPEVASAQSPNYAKYPGDTLGLTSHYVQKQWVKRIYDAENTHKNIENYIPDDFSSLSFSPLAEVSVPKRWELAAVAPDLFDVTYFTILPSYMETYYGNLQAWPGFNPPRDFGGGIRQQVEAWPVPFPGSTPLNRPFYVIKDLSHLLTGWNPPKKKYTTADKYPAVESETQFAKCDKWDYELDNDGDARMATGCVFGGRTGYSVKMINKEHLRDDVIRGGLTPIPSGSGWNW